MKIQEIRKDSEAVNIIGRVISVRDKRITTSDGKTVLRKDIFLGDGTGYIWFRWWRPKVDVNVGDIIRVINPTVNEYNGRLYLDSNYRTRVIVNPINDPEASEIPSVEELKSDSDEFGTVVKISDIDEMENKKVTVIGTVMKVYAVRVKERDDGSKMKYIVIGLDDETGYTKVILFDDVAVEFVGEDVFNNVENMNEDEYSELLARLTYELAGKEVIVSGKVKILDRVIGNDFRTRIYGTSIMELDSETARNFLSIEGSSDEREFTISKRKIIIGKTVKIDYNDYSVMVDVGESVKTILLRTSKIPTKGKTIIASVYETKDGELFCNNFIEVDVKPGDVAYLISDVLRKREEIISIVNNINEKIEVI